MGHEVGLEQVPEKGFFRRTLERWSLLALALAPFWLALSLELELAGIGWHDAGDAIPIEIGVVVSYGIGVCGAYLLARYDRSCVTWLGFGLYAGGPIFMCLRALWIYLWTI